MRRRGSESSDLSNSQNSDLFEYEMGSGLSQENKAKEAQKLHMYQVDEEFDEEVITLTD